MAKIHGIQSQLDDSVAAAYISGRGSAEFDAASASVNKLRGELITALNDLGNIPDYSTIDPKSVTVYPDGNFLFDRTENGIPFQIYGQFKNRTGKFFDQAKGTYYTFTNGKLTSTSTPDPGRVTPDDELLFNTITALVGAPAAAALIKGAGVGAFRGLTALLSREGADRVTGITGKNVLAEALAAAQRRAPNAEAAALKAQAEKAAEEAAKAAAALGPLANASKAVIDPKKFERYSMDPANPNNKGKWQAWARIGFQVDTEAGRAAATQQVLPQIRAQLPNSPASLSKVTPHGERFEVDSIINGPSGRGTLKMVYQMEDGIPRLITNWLEVHK
ncbi:MAG TPA: hypothetical protein VJ777_11405 [Mycobacterium sp.]|nr:hypothetical protein [Mycobacterium sp.]